jgi:hypothetical protein
MTCSPSIARHRSLPDGSIALASAHRNARFAGVRIHRDPPDDPRIGVECRRGTFVLARSVLQVPIAGDDPAVNGRHHVADDVRSLGVVHRACIIIWICKSANWETPTSKSPPLASDAWE